MQAWDARLANAGSVAQVMAIMGEFLRNARSERHSALLPPNCRHIVLTTPGDVQWWLKELQAAPAGQGAARAVTQTTCATLAAARDRLEELGYHLPVEEPLPR
jgi:hypothetical protein